MKNTDKDIFFFQGAGRSGLELIVSLIDGHEEALSLPFTIKFLSIWKKINLIMLKTKVIINTFLLRSKLHDLIFLNEYSYVNGKI